MCARRRTFFLLRRQKKEGKEKATPSLRPPFALSGERGQPAMLGSGVGVDELASFFELRSNSIDELDDEACVSFGTHAHPSFCASRRSQQGWGAGSKTAAAFAAALGVGYALRAADAPTRSEANRAERSNGPFGAPNPFWTCREAQKLGWRVCRRTHALRHLARRSCLTGAPSKRERREFFGAPQLRASQVARSEAKGHGQQGRLSFGYFSLAKQRTSTSAAGPRPGSRP